jgi:hypothetical protein
MPRFYLHSIAYCSLILLSSGCGLGRKTAEQIQETAKQSVVLITDTKGGYGTGFAIEGEAGTCRILTAKHVVKQDNNISIFTLTGKVPFQSTQIRRSVQADLAVVTFSLPAGNNCPFTPLKLGDSQGLSLEQKVYIASYSGGFGGKVAKQSFYITNIIEKSTDSDGYGIMYRSDTIAGTSGSPIFNDIGEVIAVHGRSHVDRSTDSATNNSVYIDMGIPINVYKNDSISQNNSVIKDSPLNSFFTFAKVVFAILIFFTITIVPYLFWIKTGVKAKLITGLSLLSFIGYSWLNNDVFWGDIKLESGDKQGALLLYDKSIQRDPNNYHAYLRRAWIKSSLKDEQGAIDDCNKALQSSNIQLYEKRGVYLTRGESKFKLANIQGAIDDYNIAIQLVDDSYYIYYLRANAKSKLKFFDGAITDYNKAIQLSPDYSGAYYNRAIARKNLGDKKGSLADYQKAADLFKKEGKPKEYNNAIYYIKELGK